MDNQQKLTAARKRLMEHQKLISAYGHAIALINYDGVTTAPENTADNRAVSISLLEGETYRLSTSEELIELLDYLAENKEALTEKENRMVALLQKDLRETRCIPKDEYIAFCELCVRADDVWHKAKEASDFELFRPCLEELVATVKRFSGYVAPGKAPYEQCLDSYEEGLTTEALDAFFGTLRGTIVPLVKEISKKQQIDDGIRFGFFPASAQEKLSYYLMETMGLDLSHVGLATTEHPFTTSFGSHFDTRITTHYHEDDFASSMYSVLHEGGHALYETGSDDDLAYTVLDGGGAMSLHESQSRFYENILGRSEGFCSFLFPKLCELFPEQMKGRGAEEFYRAVNKAQPSLVRTEADELTYCLHIMVRYELERRLLAGDLKVADLPRAWNALYKDYLGIEPRCDREGVLQDSHWSSALIGYFPSYALGNAYGAQFLAEMKKTVDVDGDMARGDFSAVNAWNRERIWRFGHLYPPTAMLEKVLGTSFDAKYYTDYLTEKYTKLYEL